MARAFKSTPKGFAADLERAERRLLRTLFQDVIQLLDAEPAGPGGAGPDGDAAFWDIVSGLGPLGGAPGAATGGRAGAPAASGGGDPSVPPQAPAPARPHREAPADPALARLLPAGVEGDAAAAAEFRELTEDAVRRTKTEDLQRAIAALQANPVVLSEPEAVSFGRALNDVRLVLSARLGIESEEDAERVHAVDDWSAATDVESYMALLYNFTTWLLETLMTALSTRLAD